jgi:cytochrome c oxidase subunit 4
MSDHHHPVTPKKVYFAIFGSLMVLTAVTVAVATVDLGALNTPVALLIAGAKAALVVWFFMEVRHAEPLTKVVALSGVLGLLITGVFTFADYLSRGWLPIPQGW